MDRLVHTNRQPGMDVRLLNVQNPWAELIKLGLKTEETRSQKLPISDNTRVLIVASKGVPSKATMDNAKGRLEACGRKDVADRLDTMNFSYQAVVAVVKFSKSIPPGRSISPWAVKENHSWVVSHCVPLSKPIQNVPGSLSMRYLHRLHKSNPGLHDRIVESLQNEELM